MIRALAYLVLGWLLIAVVGGLADVLRLTVMLPATSAIVVTHVAFARGPSVPFGLSLAVGLGYLEDLHQGAPVGTLTLAYALAFLIVRWASGRIHLGGLVMRALASMATVILVDLLTAAILFALAEPLGVRREAIGPALLQTRWHALATLLAAPPVWMLIEWIFALLRIEDRPPQQAHWNAR